ncbi:MAG: HAMP domain-containing sensor histidine kinase [Bacilli bacterium]|nr:HAMP domain-containing sensor histidine kinase [Bacilli bacterium]MDY5058862.1 HAMP domain-containing sensor histidine kinase [Bacilli bacterium]
MKNKIRLKQYFISTFIVSICLFVLFLVLNIYEYHTYTNNFNNKIGAIVNVIKDKYPEITDKEIITILNSNDFESNDFFTKYGIDINNKSVLLNNDKDYHTFLIVNMSFLTITIIALLIIYIRYNHKKENDIKDIIKCIEQINKKNYELQIDSISEDELSILKNEIYKTTIMLKESAENSNKDKLNLKKSLEDISHQLKTPLTSILVMLDNIIEDPDMDINIRNDFIRDIKRNVVNINFLVQALLKLSKFDANTVHFIKKEYNLKNIVNESIKNVSTLCDLRNINIELNIKNDSKIICDSKWQVEAITNILKNSIDHSKDNQKVIINVENNNVYSTVEIIDFGDGISKKDISHIFERFYKGENATSDSIGIGLALAKTIIEEDNGNISVESNKNGTKFIIKYFKL